MHRLRAELEENRDCSDWACGRQTSAGTCRPASFSAGLQRIRTGGARVYVKTVGVGKEDTDQGRLAGPRKEPWTYCRVRCARRVGTVEG